jgi:nucleoside-diphosphate-sugar epimerase
MIVGSGLIARTFAVHASALDRVCLYAAGVSNSSCSDESEFERDRLRLQTTLARVDPAMLFAYFSTCSVEDPWSCDSPYIRHKVQLEELVRGRERHVVVRLPQVAGKTPNPHTLLNYLYSRIARSERFELWRNASRNIIDMDDVAAIVVDLIKHENVGGETVNVANSRNSTVLEIVAAMEATIHRCAIYSNLDKGSAYAIDTRRITDAVRRQGVIFDTSYLMRTLGKYYS